MLYTQGNDNTWGYLICLNGNTHSLIQK
jgi:hypothetical protein